MADQVIDILNSNQDYLQAQQLASDGRAFAPDNSLGQAEFLRLLTTQLQNQDPSKPMDPTTFVTDLTQMSQLEATTKMNESIVAMLTGFQNLQTMQAASIIGKNVQVNGEDFSHTQGEASPFELTTDIALTDVTVVVSDDSGVVKEILLPDMLPGSKIVEWDGFDDLDNESGSGVYKLTAYGTDENGDLQSMNTVVASRVNSVGINQDGTMTLTLATGEQIEMDAVREISG